MRAVVFLILLTFLGFLSCAAPRLSLIAGSGLPSFGLACHDQEGALRWVLGLNPGLGLGFRHFLISNGPFPRGAGIFWGGGTILCFWPYLELGLARLFCMQSDRPLCISLGLLVLPPVRLLDLLEPAQPRLIPLIGLSFCLPLFRHPLQEAEKESEAVSVQNGIHSRA